MLHIVEDRGEDGLILEALAHEQSSFEDVLEDRALAEVDVKFASSHLNFFGAVLQTLLPNKVEATHHVVNLNPVPSFELKVKEDIIRHTKAREQLDDLTVEEALTEGGATNDFKTLKIRFEFDLAISQENPPAFDFRVHLDYTFAATKSELVGRAINQGVFFVNAFSDFG